MRDIESESRPEAASAKNQGSRPPGEFLPGAILSGRYRVVSLLGRGGRGDVYRADDLKLGEAVAAR